MREIENPRGGASASLPFLSFPLKHSELKSFEFQHAARARRENYFGFDSRELKRKLDLYFSSWAIPKRRRP